MGGDKADEWQVKKKWKETWEKFLECIGNCSSPPQGLMKGKYQLQLHYF